MKRSTYINILAALAVGMTAGGCADDTFDVFDPVHGFDTDHDVTLNLRLPAFSQPSTRAVDENALQDIMIYYLGSDNSTIATESIKSSDLADGNVTGKEYTTTVTVPAGTTSLRIVGNYTVNALDGTDLMTFNPNDKSYLVFYGATSVADLDPAEGGNGNIDLYRSCAKTTFALDENLENFRLTGLYFVGNPSSGRISYDRTDAPSLPEGVSYSTTDVNVTPADGTTTYYHYEAGAGKCYWILKGSYAGGTESYYKVQYIETPEDGGPATDNSELPLIRNHHYEYVIKGVNHNGYSTLAEAKKAPADNRLHITLKDHADKIFDIISCSDYYLGVNDLITIPADADTDEFQNFEIISNYTGGIPSVALATGGDSFIDPSSITVTTSSSTTDEFTDGKLYTVSYKTRTVNQSSEPRTDRLIVRVGDLSREVIVEQAGVDYFDGNTVKVALVNLNDADVANAYNFSKTNGVPSAFKNTSNVTDYFAFMRGEGVNALKGETEAEMGAERGDGLHFPVYWNYDKNTPYEYWIKYYNLSGSFAQDVKKISGGEYFNLSPEGSTTEQYIKVTLTEAGKENYKLWTGSFSVNFGMYTVVFKVYHVGLFHKLDGTNQNPGPDGNTVKGWFYYEQADVMGSDNQVYHILDRNIGASSNAAYSPSSTFMQNATAARGAYLHVPGQEQISDLEELLPDGFNKLPGMYHLANMGVKLFNAAQGSIGFDTQNSSLPRIYLPVAGSMDGNIHVDSFHCNVWSSTMIQGNQGFFPGDKEYGYWYRILDVYGSDINVSTARIQSRATNAYKGIPVRAMACPPAEPGWELPTVATGRSRIILMNEAGWTSAKINLLGGMSGSQDMNDGDAEKTWFYVDLKDVPTSVSFSGSGASTQTFSGFTYKDGIATFSNKGAEGIPTLTIYFKGIDGRVPNDNTNVYINFSGGSDAGKHKMTQVTLNNQKWYKYEGVPIDNTKLRFNSYNDKDDYQTGEYSSLKSDYETYGSPLYYEMQDNNDWSVKRVNAPSGGGDTPDPTPNSITLYLENNFNWNNLRIHYWIDPNNALTTWGNNGDGLPQWTAYKDKWYVYKIDGRSDVEHFLVKELNGGQTSNYDNLQNDIKQYGSVLKYHFIYKDNSHQIECLGAGQP